MRAARVYDDDIINNGDFALHINRICNDIIIIVILRTLCVMRLSSDNATNGSPITRG